MVYHLEGGLLGPQQSQIQEDSCLFCVRRLAIICIETNGRFGSRRVCSFGSLHISQFILIESSGTCTATRPQNCYFWIRGRTHNDYTSNWYIITILAEYLFYNLASAMQSHSTFPMLLVKAVFPLMLSMLVRLLGVTTNLVSIMGVTDQ